MVKILVADDSIAVRKVAERILTGAGFGVALAANGEEALAYLAKDRADVIVSDVIMPDKSGYEVCAYVRSDSRLAATPVLLISGIVNDEVTKQAEFCRADGVLKKPFQGTSLRDKVLELLATRQSRETALSPTPISDPSQASTFSRQVGFAPDPPTASPGMVSSPGMALRREHAPEPGRTPDSSGSGDPRLLNKLKEVEEQLRAEQARTESLAKRITDLEGEVSRAKALEALLEAERRRVSELEALAAASELQVARISQLEASLREERESTVKARQEAAAMKHVSETIAQLEAALDTERTAAAQLVEQITDLEAAAAHGKKAEAMLVQEIERTAEFKRKADEAESLLLATRAKTAELESELAVAQRKVLEHEQRLSELEGSAAKARDLEALLATERDRNAVLVRKVSEAEQIAVNATKRFEEMARRLGQIASLASQLGKGTEES